MKQLSGFVTLAKNKYFISIVLFISWMLFFDPKDWSLISARRDKLKELQKSEAHLTGLITETREELDLLRTNAGTIEKYAREKYLMKKDNEDLFIVNTR
jgi:cell division protein DivIC